MKHIYIALIFALATVSLTGCDDSYLDKQPVTGLTEDNAFVTYDNFKAFAWPLYEIFTDQDIGTSLADYAHNGPYRSDINAGYLEYKYASSPNPYAYQTVASVASGNGWDFSKYVRRANILLSHLGSADLTADERDHWQAVAYYFHAYWYIELISRFGDVPWVTQVLSESADETYGPRVDRKVVADSVLLRLKWAEEHIGDYTSRDGANTLTKDAVLATISRFALREATWRKYHELGDYEQYLREVVRTSELLIEKYPTLYYGTDGQPAAGYGEVWTTEDLGSVPGIIFYKQYVDEINPHNMSHTEHTATGRVEMNHNTVDLYLMKNGKPITQPASGYHGDKDMYAQFRDRDPRLYHVVIPPYKVKAGAGDYPSWSFTDNPADREYIDIMGRNESCSNPGIGMKRLPGQNWSASLVPEIPRLGTGAFVTCRSGYYFWKNWSAWETSFNGGALNTADKPIFKIEEILLNEAEAKWELGQFNQSVADNTINKLRERAGVGTLNLFEVNEDYDTNRGRYYPKDNIEGIVVDPVLWEIRRERIVELIGEGFGFYDIRRWRMAPWFLNRTATGIHLTKEEALANSSTLYNPETGFSDGQGGALTEGEVFLFNNPIKEGKGWLEKYYLYQIPTTELILNPNLTQNPGW